MGDVELLTYEPISLEVDQLARAASDRALRCRADALRINPEAVGLASIMVSRELDEGQRWIRFLSTDGQTWYIPLKTKTATDIVAIAAEFGEMLAEDILPSE